MKCQIVNCRYEPADNYLLIPEDLVDNIVRDISLFANINDFYSNKFNANPCKTLYDPTIPAEAQLYTNCTNDPLLKSANNSQSLSKIITDDILIIKMQKKYQDDNNLYINNTLYSSSLFGISQFHEIEYIHYNFIQGVSDKLYGSISIGLNDNLYNMKIAVISLLCLFCSIVIIFNILISFYYTEHIIQLLSI